MVLLQVSLVTALVLIHLFAGRLRFLDVIPRSRWLSLAGGVSVAYVFLHVFVELGAAQRTLEDQLQLIPWIEHHAYFVALLGLAVFYGLDKMVKGYGPNTLQEAGEGGDTRVGQRLFWLHITSFALYNALIGHLLADFSGQGVRTQLLFAAAMALHLLVIDHGMQQTHQETYRRKGRWVLVGGILLGWGAGWIVPLGGFVLDVVFAFLAGGIVLNVLKEELPAERKSRYVPFALGALGYAVLLMLL